MDQVLYVTYNYNQTFKAINNKRLITTNNNKQ